MSRSITGLLFAICCSLAAAGCSKATGVGEPLHLTPLIEKGSIREARRKAEVHYDGFGNVKSYSGFITVNKAYNSNAYFWFVLSQSNPSTDPVLLYSDGGPGSAATSVLFNYNGPFLITKDQQLKFRNDTLTKNHNVVYLDNPIGAGFSYTDNDAGYLRTQDDVGRYIIAFLEQFYKLFPEYRRNDLYSVGASYAGRFTVTASRAVRDYNQRAQEKINLKGLILGNAFVDLAKQQFSREFLYSIGLLDHNEREQMKLIDDRMAQLNENTTEYVIQVGAKYELLSNFSGFASIFNYLRTDYPPETGYYSTWIQTAAIRRAIHVGERPFVTYFTAADGHFADDIRQSVAPVLERALADYRVLSYTGQLDMHFPYSSSENLYRSLRWSGAEEYRRAKKEMWYYQGVLAGYRKKVGNFEEAIVRNAGHIADFEQPAWVCDLITDFTRRK